MADVEQGASCARGPLTFQGEAWGRCSVKTQGHRGRGSATKGRTWGGVWLPKVGTQSGRHRCQPGHSKGGGDHRGRRACAQ